MSKSLQKSIFAALVGGFLVFGISGCTPPSPEVSGREPQPPSWLAGLPERAVEAAPGETVWAVVPEIGSEGARLGTYLVESGGAEAVLIDGLGNRHERVPGALVHPSSIFPEAELSPGVAVLADRWDTDGVVGRVTNLQDGQVELAYDWNGVTVTSPMDAVLGLPTGEGSLALRWMSFRTEASDAWQKGLCIAESDDQLWIRTDSGRVEIVARDAVQPLADLGQATLEPGTTVAAYSWDQGYRSGVIEAVLEPGLRYAVKFDGGEVRAVFFDSLTTASL